MPAAYKKASRHGLLWFLIIIGGLALSLTIASQIASESLGAWMLLIFTVPIVISIIVAAVISNRLDKKRLNELGALFERKGIRMITDPTPEEKTNFYHPVSFLTEWMGLQAGAANIQWIAANNEVGIFEHVFFTGSGKHTQEHLETVIIAPSPYRTEGGMTARRAGYSMKRAWRKSDSKFEIGDPEFDKDWVLAGNPEIGYWFLIKQVREILTDAPMGESWVAGNNYVCLSFDGVLEAKNMEIALDRVLTVKETVQKFVPFLPDAANPSGQAQTQTQI